MRNKKVNAQKAANALGKFFVNKGKLYSEEEYKNTSRFKTPCKYTTIIRLFDSYSNMLSMIEETDYAEGVKALKPKPAPKPKPKVEAPKAPATPKKVQPAKAKEDTDE